MRLDNLASFLPYTGVAQTLIGGAGVDVQIGDIIDLLGAGVGVAPPNIIGNVTLFGTDFGIDEPFIIPKLDLIIGTSLTTSTSAAPNFKIQYAADLGTPTYQPSTWTTAVETGPIAVSQLTAGTVAAKFGIPAVWPANLRPRYSRLIMSPGTGALLTAGTVLFAGYVPVRDNLQNLQAASNFQVQ